jgi:hypothetical protein
MPFPSGLLRWTGDWSATQEYRYGDIALASTNVSYACGVPTSLNVDPATQPSSDWFPFPSSGGGDPSTWSDFPATQNVDLATNDIDNVNEIALQTVRDANGSVGTAGQLLASSGTISRWEDPLVIKSFSNNLYVSQIAGDDMTGNGTITNPYQTLGAALAVANTSPDTNRISIILAAGIYTENVSMTRPNVFISGAATSLPSATHIDGTITINMTSVSVTRLLGGISSVQVNSINLTSSPSQNQSVLISDCLIIPALGAHAISATDTVPNGPSEITIQSCTIWMSDIIATTFSGVYATLINTEITNNPNATAGTASLVETKSTARVEMYGCVLTQTSTLSTVEPLVIMLNNTATAAGTVFYNSSLVYTSTTSDTGTGNKCCIQCANGAAIASIILFNNFLICQGATTDNGIPGNFVVLQRTGAGTVTVLHGQNSGGTTAHHLPQNGGGFTKTPYVNVT